MKKISGTDEDAYKAEFGTCENQPKNNDAQIISMQATTISMSNVHDAYSSKIPISYDFEILFFGAKGQFKITVTLFKFTSNEDVINQAKAIMQSAL